MNKDNGLQRERTALSWLRTQLVLFGIGIVLFRYALFHEQPAIYITSVIAILIAFSCSLFSSHRIKLIVSTIIFLLAFTYLGTMLDKVIS